MRPLIWRRWAAALVFAFLCAPGLFAQSFPFLIRVEQPESATVVSNGGGVSINSTIGQSQTFTVALTYIGQGSALVRGVPQLVGSGAFAVISADAAPANLANGQTYRFTVRFTPTRSQAVISQITMPTSESVTGGNGVTVTTQSLFLLQLQGTAPELSINYIGAELQSYTPVQEGGTISFSPTPIGFANSVIIAISNRGSGSADLRSVSALGAEFQVVGLGLLPAALAPNSEARFTLRFQPTAEGQRTGRLLIGTTARNFDLNLSGEAFQIRFAYESITSSGVSEITPGGTINLGEVLPGETQSTQILVRNINPIAIALPAIAVFGAGFSLSENPGTRTLRPGETVSFFITAQASQIGAQRGRLRVGDDAFDLLITASGSQLRYSYSASNTNPVALAPNGSVFFPPTQIGSVERTNFTVRNTGISEASIINISTGDISGVFVLESLPALPAKLLPGQELTFAIRFQPSTAGLSVSVLRIDGASFALNGTASALPPLPAYRFTLATGSVNALSQPQVGLQLDANYPSPLNGVITLSQEAAGFANDPSVRFSNGEQSISFTIPANSTQAVFANGLNLVRFQTGSVAGTILLRATFNVGGAAITDPSPQVLRLSIAPAAPRILSAYATPSAANSLQIGITGLTLSRSLTQLQLDLTAAAGFTLSATRFTINLEGESLAWFRSSNSQGSGGVFQLVLPLNLSLGGNSSAVGVSNLLEAISSINVTLSNETGVSAPFTIQLRP